MDEIKIRVILEKYIVDSAMPNIGFLMGSFNRDYGGQADNKIVMKIANEIISKHG